METVSNYFHRLYPILTGMILSGVFYWQKIDYKLPNFEKVLDNTTIFSSIVIGFLGALLGILVSIKDTEIVKAIFRTEEKSTLKLFFNETFIVGMIVVVLSTIMQVVRTQETIATLVLFHIWLAFSVWFIPSTYRIVSILMSVFFKTNSVNSTDRPEEENKITGIEEKEIKNRLSKPGT